MDTDDRITDTPSIVDFDVLCELLWGSSDTTSSNISDFWFFLCQDLLLLPCAALLHCSRHNVDTNIHIRTWHSFAEPPISLHLLRIKLRLLSFLSSSFHRRDPTSVNQQDKLSSHGFALFLFCVGCTSPRWLPQCCFLIIWW